MKIKEWNQDKTDLFLYARFRPIGLLFVSLTPVSTFQRKQRSTVSGDVASCIALPRRQKCRSVMHPGGNHWTCLAIMNALTRCRCINETEVNLFYGDVWAFGLHDHGRALLNCVTKLRCHQRSKVCTKRYHVKKGIWFFHAFTLLVRTSKSLRHR